MACFIGPMGLGIVTTIFRKKVPEYLKINWLNIMLAIEHISHGEVILYPPFLTEMQTPAAISGMLEEMAVFGSAMTLVIVAILLVMVYINLKLTQRVDLKTKNNF